MSGHPAQASVDRAERITFRVLGPLDVEDATGRPIDIGGGKPATLLALLLLHHNEWVGTDQLIEAIWTGRDVPVSAQRNLKTYVWQLRRSLPAWPDGPRIESRPGAYRVRTDAGELDADAAMALGGRARQLLEREAAGEAAELLVEALELWRGRPYDGLGAEFAGSAVSRLAELHWSLREDLADAYLTQGRCSDAIAMLRAITDEEPLRELGWTRLMAALQRSGRRHDALAAYQRARTALLRDLGVEPGPELTALHRELLGGDGAGDGPAAEGSEGDRPDGDRPDGDGPDGEPMVRSDLPRALDTFVGRSKPLARIAAATACTGVPVVTIDGMPGIGKTTLALQAAHALAGSYPDGQIFLDLRTHGPAGAAIDTAEALGRLVKAVAGSVTPLPERQDELAALWRSAVSGRQILLVLDDVRDAGQVRSLLPGAAGCLVLVTARQRLTGLDSSTAVSLDLLTDQEAQELLGPLDQVIGTAGATDVLRRCGGHPEAVRLMADRLRDRSPWTAARFAARLETTDQRRSELAALHNRLDTSYRLMTEPVRRVYRLLGLTPVFDVRRAARLADCGQADIEPVLDLLLDAHLISEPAPGRFALHPLVHDHARRTLVTTEPDDELAAAAARARIGTIGRAELELVAPDDPQVA